MDNKKQIYECMATLTPTENTISHHGIKGQKWGVRRFQNADGTLTEAGQKRYNRDTADMSDGKKKKYVANPDKWVNEDISNTKRALDEGGSIARRLKESNDAAIRSTPKSKMDLSKMSDNELREAVNRYNLEQQYINAFAQPTVSKGRAVVGKMLDATTTTLTIAGSAAALALSIRALMGKG